MCKQVRIHTPPSTRSSSKLAHIIVWSIQAQGATGRVLRVTLKRCKSRPALQWTSTNPSQQILVTIEVLTLLCRRTLDVESIAGRFLFMTIAGKRWNAIEALP